MRVENYTIWHTFFFGKIHSVEHSSLNATKHESYKCIRHGSGYMQLTNTYTKFLISTLSLMLMLCLPFCCPSGSYSLGQGCTESHQLCKTLTGRSMMNIMMVRSSASSRIHSGPFLYVCCKQWQICICWATRLQCCARSYGGNLMRIQY